MVPGSDPLSPLSSFQQFLILSGVSDDEMREMLKKAEADLLWVWQQNEIDLETQYKLAVLGYVTVRKFSGIDDTRQAVRAAMQTDLQIDPTAAAPLGPKNRVTLASIVSAWETSREQITREVQVRAESKALNIQRPLLTTDRQIMRRALESRHGKLQSHEVPSADYLAQKTEEIETGEPTAASLDEVTSLDDVEAQSLQAVLDVSGSLKITKKKGRISMPTNSEEFRLRLRVEANTWMMLALKFTNIQYLAGLERNTWFTYTDYFLGKQVSRIEIVGAETSVQVPWRAVLNYEFACRKLAFKMVRENEKTLDEALILSIKDAECKEVNFTAPIALGLYKRKFSEVESATGQVEKWTKPNSSSKGKGTGKGKTGAGKGKGGGKQARDPSSRKNFLSYTPDGRQICFKFNNEAGCQDGNCARVHVCQVPGCNQPHAAVRCPKRKKD